MGIPCTGTDTVIVRPIRSLAVRLIAEAPVNWMVHCHNGYHQKPGMVTRLDYTG
ncbi:multicopper oxidase domain-containing protein [Rhodococcus pseudokoreensis]|uniref:multicopper oxidase domain-containing protein n=1 Tax=Rhodococcus pseudokoreensis TaxID=2811421 RepID=UPI001F126986|nr:multicopper oxidase domain-containing protein [Rhodococcus pseudokoreensis]